MKKVLKIFFTISFVFYLSALIILLFLDSSRGYLSSDLSMIEYTRNYSNFVPFTTISMYITVIIDRSMNLEIPIKNLFGNFIMFLPMGIYLPYYIKKANKVSVFTVSMVSLLFFIEIIQLVSRRGSFDIDDFILNMLGALVGFSIWKTNIVQNLLR
ncbi:VanZ family protein [Oceanobacillus zhaokaii]|uniref:VanZ family protein n=1 Tax=Oceanobacillus zhaokaii TaxID=2052660 RepID=A0A345PFE8_9BACI|nr:VanZ family protein [Oceanobacillus zhaokaii]AXI08728.1 VanZ family protein [Oceanobacillus zhaokaii]